jgi:pyruvate dehydrogenase E1 component beta subunit
MDWEKIFFSVRKTGQLLVLDTGNANNSVAGEIIARVSMECWSSLKAAPRRIAMPDIPVPTSVALTKGLYPGVVEIGQTIGQMLGIEIDIKELTRSISKHHDVPGEWFQGPF